jgi:hypothetical protein
MALLVVVRIPFLVKRSHAGVIKRTHTDWRTLKISTNSNVERTYGGRDTGKPVSTDGIGIYAHLLICMCPHLQSIL